MSGAALAQEIISSIKQLETRAQLDPENATQYNATIAMLRESLAQVQL